ncbi:MAG: enoyl-CoA hydratase/isomerase family protein [Chloroflexi bacterium]|nr:enoyl-CoA hydratase/isomerase family protein [Chloroflexota bacterium]
MANEVLYETKGHVAIITMNRPEAHNAVSPEVSAGLRAAFRQFRDDRNLRAAVLTGAGEKAFTAGADLKRMAQRGSADFADGYWWPPSDSGYVEVWKPVIAAVNGYCYAEGLNLLCGLTDIRISSDTATYCYAEILRGFSGTGVAIELLPRQVAYAKAMEWLLMGKVFNAQEAYQAGLVNEIVPLAKVRARAIEVAEQISALAPVAVRALKEAAVRGLSVDVPNAMRLAGTIGVLTRYTEDAHEGPRAFAEKRPPVYKGR